MKLSKIGATDNAPDLADGMALIVVGAMLVLFVIRGLIPALISGVDVSTALVALGLLTCPLLILLVPIWRRRRSRRLLGRLGTGCDCSDQARSTMA